MKSLKELPTETFVLIIMCHVVCMTTALLLLLLLSFVSDSMPINQKHLSSYWYYLHHILVVGDLFAP